MEKYNATALAAAKGNPIALEFLTEGEIFLQLGPAISVLGTRDGNAMQVRQAFFPSDPSRPTTRTVVEAFAAANALPTGRPTQIQPNNSPF